MNVYRIFRYIFIYLLFVVLLASCSQQKIIGRAAKRDILTNPALLAAHVGISIYEPATGKRWYDYNGEKYFVPASNIKIATCYLAMKYLGDSLPGIRYSLDIKGQDTAVVIFPTGDPTFLHADFPTQPVYNYLYNNRQKLLWQELAKEFAAWGAGWAWDDFHDDYMAERSVFPIYGNLVKILKENGQFYVTPGFFADKIKTKPVGVGGLKRAFEENIFYLDTTGATSRLSIPFKTEQSILPLIGDTLKYPQDKRVKPAEQGSHLKRDNYFTIYSQPTDSVLKPMMHRSDNFFAEQLLLMVSNERLGMMNDKKIIDTTLKTDFSGLPQKAGWVDGSGLSRYNFFTPADFVFMLGKIKDEFGMERVRSIFPAGGKGTLSGYYQSAANNIYAKTGTLSGVVALSGYLYTTKGKELIFSILVNNHQSSASHVRRAIEKFLESIRRNY